MDPDQAFSEFYKTGLRADGQLAVCQFLAAEEVGAGGLLVVRAAFKRGGRGRAEAGYQSERWGDLIAAGMARQVAPSHHNS